MKFSQNLLCSWIPWVLLSRPQLLRNHFLVSLPKNSKMIWCNLLVISDEVWNVRALTTYTMKIHSTCKVKKTSSFDMIKGLKERQKCPYSKFSCPYFPAFELNMDRYDWIYFSVFSPNAGKYKPEKIRMRKFSRITIIWIFLVLVENFSSAEWVKKFNIVRGFSSQAEYFKP